MSFLFRRGTDAERLTITPKLGEPLYVTDTGKLFVGDGTTLGGRSILDTVVVDDTTPALGGNLDLNGNDIIGSGNINIDGTITATGSINLGDDEVDNISIEGVIDSDLIPSGNNIYSLGDVETAWSNLFVQNIDVEESVVSPGIITENISVSEKLETVDLQTTRIIKENSTVLYDSANDELNLENIILGTELDVTEAKITGPLVPSAINQYTVGTDENIWAGGFFQNLDVYETLVVPGITASDINIEQNITASDLRVDTISKNESNLLYNSDNDQISITDLEVFGVLKIEGMEIKGPLSPTLDKQYDLGFSGQGWDTGYIETIVSNSVITNKIYKEDSSLLYNDLNDELIASKIDISNTAEISGTLDLSQGTVASSLIPNEDALYDLGAVSAVWRRGYFEELEVDSFIQTSFLISDKIFKEDSTILFDSDLDRLYVSSIETDAITGDVVGSVFSDSSELLVDGLSGYLVGPIDTDTLEVKTLNKKIADFKTVRGADIPYVQINVSNGTIDSPANVDKNELLSGFRIQAYADGSYKTTAALVTQLTSDADYTAQNPKSDCIIGVGNNTSQSHFKFKGEGTFESPGAVKPAVYANETERDNAIPNPEAGMMIFLAGHDDSTGFPKFQGYDGVDWRDLH
jgi:hypothetical protein